MMRPATQCHNCDYRRMAPDGVCSRQAASDGNVLRCVGPWTEDKHHYLKNYLSAFTTATYKRWETRNYIELFAGPGKCLEREAGREIDGSPLLALQCEHPFATCIFVERNPLCMHALRLRALEYTDANVSLVEDDCNAAADGIAKSLEKQSVNLAFIDPTGIQIDFDSILRLTTDSKVDLIINFSQDMAIERNAQKWANTDAETPLDRFMGTREWREGYQALVKKQEMHLTARLFIDIYRQQLARIGYSQISSIEPHIRSAKKNLPLYYLLFASKHQLGYKLWNDIARQDRKGQRPLF